MTREIEAPWKPKIGDQVTFNSTVDGVHTHEVQMWHGHIRKVLKGTNVVHIEATGGRWYECDIEEDNVSLVKNGDNTGHL